MSIFNVLNIAASGASAQLVRFNTSASNISNAESVSSSEGGTYKPRYAVFSEIKENAFNRSGYEGGVQVSGIVESKAPPQKEYRPDHPLADNEGYIYKPDFNLIEGMVDMMSASQTYQTTIDIMSTAKQMGQRTLQLGK